MEVSGTFSQMDRQTMNCSVPQAASSSESQLPDPTRRSQQLRGLCLFGFQTVIFAGGEYSPPKRHKAVRNSTAEKFNRSQKKSHSTLLEFNIGTCGINSRQYCSVSMQHSQNMFFVSLLPVKLPFVRSDDAVHLSLEC